MNYKVVFGKGTFDVYACLDIQKLAYFRVWSFINVFLDINPIPTEGGQFGPGQPKAVSHFHSFMTKVTKTYDFVHLSIPLVPVKLFLKKEIWNFKNLKKEKLLFWNQRVHPLEKKI